NNGWSVIVNPNGNIEGGYDYLFYEAKLNYLENPLKGWCIQYKSLENWMDMKLIELGLNKKEKEEFEEFWLNFLPYANYYIIKLTSIEYLNTNMGLYIDPIPDVVIRVILIFEPSQSPLFLEEPAITSPTRTGFTVVEWGGFFIN
ncbi:MAG: hypothetical protein KGD63_13825, partial [Candidatus Lokiarchaeota archaeon]|nr:hypothetical protein [Candidatus Lokiarchaeota archaeon]